MLVNTESIVLYSKDCEDEWVHDRYIEAVKKQLGIFHNVFHVLFSVSPKQEALLWSYELNDILQAYQYIIVAHNKHEMSNINYTCSRLCMKTGGLDQAYH